MKFGLGNLGLRSAPSIPRRVAALLRRFNASLILPGEQTPVGLVNLLTYSNDFSNAAWTKASGATATATTLTITADALSRVYQGKTFSGDITVAVQCDPSDAGKQLHLGVWASGLDGITTGRTPTALTIPASGVVCYSWAGTVSGTNVGIIRTGTEFTLNNPRIALFQGTVTAQQIIDNGGIPVTTTYPRSISYSDTINGFRTGNWTDSVGSIPATIDGKTGLVVDAAGSVGPELVTNGDNEAQLAGIGPAGRGTVTRSTERAYAGVASAKYVCNDASTGAHTLSLANVSANQSIFVECWVFADTGNFANIDLFDFNDGSWVTSSISVKGQWARLTGVRPAKGSAWNLRVGDRAFTSNLGQSFYIDNISVRELTGTHALQATDGYKPVERRGLVNLLWSSNNLANTTYWTHNDGAVVTANATTTPSGLPASLVDLTATTTARVAQQNSISSTQNSSSSTTLAVLLRAETTPGTVVLQARRGDGTFVNILVNVTTDWQVFTLDIPVATGIHSSLVWVGNRGTGGTCHRFFVGNAALFAGTVTAQQIIDAGGIPVTTDAPKSSSLGPRYFYTDGTDDHLRTSFIPGSSFTITAAYQLRSAAGSAMKSVVGGKSSTGDRVYVGGYNGFHSAILGTGLVIQSNVPDTQLAVCTLSVTGGVATLRVNGVVKGTLSGYGTALPGVGLFIGASNNAELGPANFADANIHAVEMVNSTLTDAELLLLEKFAGKLAGVQI